MDDCSRANSTGRMEEEGRLRKFTPDDPDNCAAEWEDYKREFLVHLDSKGLWDKPGRQQVGLLLKYMGIDAIRLYDTFEWAPEIPAVVADPAHNVEAHPAVPGESKEKLSDVFKKSNECFGVHHFRAIKRRVSGHGEGAVVYHQVCIRVKEKCKILWVW